MNKNIIWLFLLAVVLILLITFRKPITEKVKSMVRGYRNNNPGNIRLTFDKSGKKTFWTGEIEGTDKSFKVFKSMEYGYRAIFLVLLGYMKRKVNTIETIINTYAPPVENNTEAYIKAVENETGISRKTPLNPNDTNTLSVIVKAISEHENGIKPNVQQINGGLKLV